MKINKPLIIIIILATIFSFAYTYPKYLESQENIKELTAEIDNLWLKYDKQLDRLEENLITIKSLERELDPVYELVSLFYSYHSSLEPIQFTFYSLYKMYAITMNERQEIIEMNQILHQKILQINSLLKIEEKENYHVLNDYINLYLNFYELKVEENNSFINILENEIIMMENINLIAKWLIEYDF